MLDDLLEEVGAEEAGEDAGGGDGGGGGVGIGETGASRRCWIQARFSAEGMCMNSAPMEEA